MTGASKVLAAPAWLSENLKAIIRTLIVCGLCYVVLIALFVALLALALSLSSDTLILSHLREVEPQLREAMKQEAGTPIVSAYGHSGHQFDMTTECQGLTVNLSSESRSLVYRIVVSPGKEGCGPLVLDMGQPTMTPDWNYFRFWHGYQVYVRPMLSIMSYGELRRVNAIILFSAFGVFCYQFARYSGPFTWPIFIIPFVFVGDLLTASLVTVHSISLTWIFLSVAIVGVVLERRVHDRDYLVLPVTVFVIGAIYNFLSFLFNPPLAPTFVSFLVLAKYLARSGPHRVMQGTLSTVMVVSFWFAGYAFAWIAKWVLAALVLGMEPVSNDVLRATSGSDYDAYEWASTLHMTQPTWIILSRGPSHLLSLIGLSWGIAGAVLAWGAASRRLTKGDIKDFWVLQLPLLIPIAWVEILRTASMEHIGFVYRDFLPFSILPLLAALMLVKQQSSLRIAPHLDERRGPGSGVARQNGSKQAHSLTGDASDAVATKRAVDMSDDELAALAARAKLTVV